MPPLSPTPGVASPTLSPAPGVSPRAVLIALVLFGGASLLVFALTNSPLVLALLSLILCIALAGYLGAQNLIGVFLALVPLQWLVIAYLQYQGVPGYKMISALKELFLVLMILWCLYRSSRLSLTLPDLLLATALLFVSFEQLFHTDPMGLRDDWEWVLPYMLGRLIMLSPKMQALWAKCAVWMCAVLAVVGAWEVLYLGPTPRLLLVNAAQGDTKLPPPFLATGYAGFRAASTMVSPLAFSALCVVAIILWWVYMKNPIPAILIGTGLVLTITRSAMVAAAVGVCVIAIRRKERFRIAVFGVVAVVGLLAAIPSLDLEQFVNRTFMAGGDLSIVGHQLSIVQGAKQMMERPLGLGAGTVGPRVLAGNPSALNIENSYLSMAIQYGVVPAFLFAGFVAACFLRLYRLREPIGYAAFSILIGFGLLLGQGPLHLDLPLACWVWVPVGMGVARASQVESTATNVLDA